MAAPAKKPAPRKPALRIVKGDDAIAVADRAIADLSNVQSVTTRRSVAVRNESQMRDNELVRERETYEDRGKVLTAQYEHAMKGIVENIADIDEARGILRGGIGQPEAPGTAA